MTLPQEHADQYKMLREEIAKLVEESRKVEIYAVTAVAALFAWFLTHPTTPRLPLAAWFIPSTVVVLGFIRSTALFKRVGLIASYLRRIEDKYFTDLDLPGWERFYASKGGSNPLSFTAFVFWGALALASLVAPCFLAH
jgi:hypothetical protein